MTVRLATQNGERLMRKLRQALAQLARGELGPVHPMAAQALSQQTPAAAFHALSAHANVHGHAAQALQYADCAVEASPDDAQCHFARGRALKSLERLPEAEAAYREALRLRADYAEVLVSLGIVLRLLGRYDEAAASHRRALELRPDFPEAMSNLANVLADRIGGPNAGRVTAEELREAEKIQRRALELAPTNADAMHNLAVLLKQTGRYYEAAEWFNRALGQNGSRVDSCVELGELLQREMRYDLAGSLYIRWIQSHGRHPGVEILLSECLMAVGQTDEALRMLDGIVTQTPAQVATKAALRERLLRAEKDHGTDTLRAIGWYRETLHARPDFTEVVCSYLLSLCYVEEDPAALLAEHRTRIAPVVAAIEPLPAVSREFAGPAHSRRRTRVGYLSFDFKVHSVAYFLESLYRQHDRDRFEIWSYKLNASSDEMTERLRALSEHWVECGPMTDQEIAERIRADGIDVLIDLCGYTSGSRIGILQRRPAPCQIEYLGYPGSTGADCFDFRFTDSTIDPPGEEHFSSEPLLRLPRSMFCYTPAAAMPDVAPLPALEQGSITFGSFNNLMKVGERTLRLWADVLHAVPGSRLFLKSAQLSYHPNRTRIERTLAELGIASERLQMQPFDPSLNAHFTAYHRIDIGVDTYPYSGATTTCEALYMGVPVVTLMGRTQPSRMGGSILRAAGLDELVAHDAEDYVRRVAALAADVDRLSRLRAGLRERLRATSLVDSAAFARDFEKLLVEALEAVQARDTAREAAAETA